MCGIAGQVRFDGRPVDRGLLAAMGAALAHRGPDSAGSFTEGPVGLAFRRLAIIDLSPAGAQPMTVAGTAPPHSPGDARCGGGRLRLVFNGEVYNFLALRDRLEARGHRFASRTDTEVVLHRYEEVGERVVEDLRGMFAFALWDPEGGRLVLARDRVGKKPLYYHRSGSCLTFASELAALLCEPSIERAVDPEALDVYLTYQYLPGERSLIPGVKKLPPAHVAVFSRAGLALRRYWELSYEPKLAAASEDDVGAELRDRLKEAVRLRLVSDVPLGAFLSGGVDSSAVVAMMAELSDRPVKTFSIGFDEEDYSELAHARRVARQFGTDHHEFVVRPEATSILPILVRHYGDPYADSSAIATYYVARESRRHVTVALNGDGGDESFAGYDRYVANQLVSLYRMVPATIRASVLKVLDLFGEPASAYSLLRRAKRFAAAAHGPESDAYLRLVASLDRPYREELYTRSMRGVLDRFDSGSILSDALAGCDAVAVVDRTMALDVRTYLPDDLLVKVDIATMAVGLEARSPFLDHELMEFAARLPASLKLRGRRTKYILKKALAPLLPRDLLERRKMGFGVPIKRWYRGELAGLVRDTLLDPRALSRGYFERRPLERLVEEHVSGARDHAYRLHTLLVLELWHREFIDGAPRPAAGTPPGAGRLDL
jgi:asparagine synthase (glutamine-hydrolysing)